MSGYEPQIGDRVRYVIEGECVHTDLDSGRVTLDATAARYSHISPDHVLSVEKVEPPKPPLPTTPGSVIRWRVSSASPWYCYLLQSHGRWRCQDADSWAIEPDELTGRGEIEYPFLYDAGAES